MGRKPCCAREGMNRGAWTPVEDQILKDYISTHGEGKWGNIPKQSGLNRCGKSCRLRWLNYLRPDIKRGNISEEEEDLIIRLHKLLGNRWSLIAGRLPGRTDNEIKNYWNTTLGKKVRGEQSSKQPKDEKKQIPEPSSIAATRTKALRCTNVSMTQQAPQDVVVGVAREASVSLDTESKSSDPSEDNGFGRTFTMEVDIGGFLLSDTSDSEFWKLSQLDSRWHSLDESLLFSAEEI